MKKNLILAGILSLLLIVTYVWQELRTVDEYEQSITADRLLDEEVTKVELPALSATFKDGRWWHDSELLSHGQFKQLIKKISEIKSIKKLSGDWKNFATAPLNFELNNVEWSLGDVSLDKQGFYVRKADGIHLAIIDGESTHLTQNPEEIELAKYNELRSQLMKNLSDFKEKQLFRFYDKIPLARVMISAEGQLPFELDLQNNQTSPPPIEGISVHKNLKDKFTSLLTQAFLREEIPYQSKGFSSKMGEITFIGKDDEPKMKWELWLRKTGAADAIIVDHHQKRAYLMVGGTVRMFFVGLQDYWDKKVIPPEDFTHFQRLPAKFIQGDREGAITIINREPLDFTSQKHRVKLGNMQDLFQFVFNLGHQEQPGRVSQLTKSERQQLLSGDHLRLEIMGQDLLFWRKSQELIIVNLTQGFKSHFFLQAENFNARFEDVLE